MGASEQGLPPQHQDRQPGLERPMRPRPESEPRHPGSSRLGGRVALVSGGDSGIGKAVALAFAREGADVAIVYLDEHEDAADTAAEIREEGRRCLPLQADIGDESACDDVVARVTAEFGRLDVLVNNAGEQHPQDGLEDITAAQLERTFRTNVFAMFYLTRAALSALGRGSAIINTTSVTAYRGSQHLLDYAATKGAMTAFTRSLALNLADAGIRVNAVAPGPIWTPLIPSTFTAEHVAEFGTDTPMKRPGQPQEVASCYVFLACDDSSYMTGQTMHPNGGDFVGS